VQMRREKRQRKADEVASKPHLRRLEGRG
jgi:hypothetical protein